MEFVQVDDPFGRLDQPSPELAEHERLVAACAARPDGHAWTVAGDSGELPWLSCADCPASSDDLVPDLLDELNGEEYQLGGRTIVFGDELPDAEDSVFAIPVSVRIETIRNGCPDYVTVHITDRETVA